MLRSHMGRIATRRAAYKRGFSSEGSSDKSFFALIAALGLALAAFSSLWAHINTRQGKVRCGNSFSMHWASSPEVVVVDWQNTMREEYAYLVMAFICSSCARTLQRSCYSTQAGTEQIKAITKSSRMVFCQSTTTTSGELSRRMEKELPHFKREH